MDTQQPTISQPNRLTTWTKEPSVLDLAQDFENAKLNQGDHIEKIKKWRAIRDITGKYKPPVIRGRSSVQPALVRRQAEWRYSALTEPFLGSDKLYDVSPVTFEDQEAATQNELVLNWQFRTKLNHVKFVDEYVRTTVDEGTCIVRLGWVRETQEEEIEVPVWDYLEPQNMLDLEGLYTAQMAYQNSGDLELADIPEDAVKAFDYHRETGRYAKAVKSDRVEVQINLKVTKNQPTLQIMNPENVFIDPSCEGDLDKARFIVVSFETSKAELLQDGRYKNLDKVVIGSNTPLSQPDHVTETPNSFNFQDDLRKRVVAYEYWGLYDINGNGKLVPIVATWIGSELIRLERNPFPDGKPPFVVVNYLPVKRSVYGETDAELLEDNQRILGAVTRGMIDLMARSANGQTGMAKGMLDAINRKRYDMGLDYEFNPVQHPSNGIIEHKYPELPKSSLDMLQLQNQEAEALTGVKAFSGGMSGNAYGDVAAGIRGMLDAASKREMAILRRLAKGIQEIGAKIIMMNQVFLSEEEVVRVTNKEFVTIRREDLAGQFDLMVDISTAEIDNAKAQDLGFMLQTIGPNMDFGVIKMILSEIAELKRMPALAEAIKRYEPQPTPLQQAEVERAQAEVQKLLKEIEKIDSEIEKNIALARKAQSEADMADLEFVEQETGVNHERDLQKQREQAKGNENLEITKALLKDRKPEEKPGDVMAAIGYSKLTDPKTPAVGGMRRPTQAVPQRRMVGQDGQRPVDRIQSQHYDPRQDPALNPALNF